MSTTDKVKIEMHAHFADAAVQEAVASSCLDLSKSFMREGAGIDAAEFFDDKYWERRCHQAEEHLQEIARELERKDAIIQERQYVITSLEIDNRMLSAQLDMVHLIFGAKQ